MTLIAHYKCDDNRPSGDISTLIDSSGHPNNHDMALTYFNTAIGFGHKMALTPGWFYGAAAANEADFLTFGECTIMAWFHLTSLATLESLECVLAMGDYNSELAAANLAWAFVVDRINDRFGMMWEYGAGTDVNAWAPGGSLSKGDKALHHCAVVRSINGAQRDVKFVVDGVDLAADVTGLTAPDGTLVGNSQVDAFRMPNWGFSNNLLDAVVSQLRFYDNALTVGDIQNVYAAEVGAIPRVGFEIPRIPSDWAKGGDRGGSIYLPRSTGTKLDEGATAGSLAGWESERP